MSDPYAQFADADPYAQYADHVEAAPPTLGQQINANVVSPLVRAGTKAVTALPLMAEDFGVAARNVYEDASTNGPMNALRHLVGMKSAGTLSNQMTGNTGPNYPYQLPSSVVNQALDSYTTAPTTTLGKASEFVNSAIMGAGIPGPSSVGSIKSAMGAPLPNAVPSNFVPSATTQQQTLGMARNAGYVVPPSTTNPTVFNKTIESIGGKIATAQDASMANMGVSNNLARSALGMESGAEITPAALAGIRAEAGKDYGGVISAIGDVLPTDAKYAENIAKVTAPYVKLSEELGPKFGNSEITDMADAVNRSSITSENSIAAIKALRDKADVAYGSGDKPLGKAFKALASNIEDQIDRHLESIGNTDALDKFRAARETIAKTYSVQKALNAATGNVSAIKLGQQLTKGKPLSGDLFTIAQAGQAFPRATKEILDSGSVRNTDIIAGGIASVMQHDPRYLLYPFARQGARSFLLSDSGQALAQPGAAMPMTGLAGLSQSVLAQWDLAK